MAQPQVERRRASVELTAETIVVGAGLAGCSAARFLAESGARVVVVERGGIGAGASGRNGGFLFRAEAPWINEHLEAAAVLYAALQEEGPLQFDFRRRPQLLLAVEQRELAHARAYAAAVGGEEVDVRDEAWLADDLAGAYAIEGGYTLDAMGATVAMAEAARRAGAEFVLGCEAKRILVARGRVRGLATDVGIIACERIVVAAGPRARFLLRTAGVDLPVSSTRGWLLETGKLEEQPPYAIEQAAWPAQDEMGRLSTDSTLGELAEGGEEERGLVSLLLGGRPAGHRLIGTSLARSLLEEGEGPETVRRVAERAVRVSPRLRDVPVVTAWSGRRAMTPDGKPVVGPVPGVDGVEIASGFSSIGMITIPAACRRLADGRSDAFDPARFT